MDCLLLCRSSMLSRQIGGLEKSIRQRRRWAKMICIWIGGVGMEWNYDFMFLYFCSAFVVSLLHWLQARQLFLHARNAAHHHPSWNTS